MNPKLNRSSSTLKFTSVVTMTTIIIAINVFTAIFFCMVEAQTVGDTASVGEFVAAYQRTINARDKGLMKIQGVTEEFLKAWNNGDAEGCAITYSEEAIFMPPELSSIHGREAIKKFFEDEVPKSVGEMKITEKVQEVIYFGDWATMHGLGEISIPKTNSIMEDIRFKWAMLSKRNRNGKWESVWDIYNDINL